MVDPVIFKACIDEKMDQVALDYWGHCDDYNPGFCDQGDGFISW